MVDIIKALNEATDTDGLFVVPTEFSNRLLALVQTKVVVMNDCDTRPMNSLTQYIPKVASGSTAYWVDELGTITASNMTFGRITLTAKKVAALTEASSEVLEDNNVGVADELVSQMALDVANAIDSEIISGGTYANATSSNFVGLRNTGSFTNAVDAKGTINMTHGDGTGSSLTGSTITVKAMQAAVTEVLKDNHEQPDVSYWNPKTLGQIQQLTDSAARPILNMETYGSPLLREGVTATLYGTKVKTTTQLPLTISYGTATAQSASCADAIVARSKMFGIVGQRRGFTWKQDYVIATDMYKYQTTTRLAFAIKYADAYCMIRAITDS